MSRVSKLYLEDILESCQNVRNYTDGLDYGTFAGGSKTIDAVVRNLEIIGEAVKNLSPEIRDSRPEIEWKNVARFRDIIVHHYFKVDLKIVWDVVENHVDKIAEAVREMISDTETAQN